MNRHELIDQRSLAKHRLMAEKIRANPALLDPVKTVLSRWIEARMPSVPKPLLEWREILDQWPLDRVLEFVECDTEDARRLRQSSPFCGIMTDGERSAIFEQFQRRWEEQQASKGVLTIGQQLAHARNALGKDETAMAAEAGLVERNILNLESSKGSVRSLELYAAALNCRVELVPWSRCRLCRKRPRSRKTITDILSAHFPVHRPQ